MGVREQDSLQGAVGWSIIVTIFVSGLALLAGSKAASGVASGGALGVMGLWLLKMLVTRAFETKRPHFWMLLAWLVKFPLLCVLLYFLIAGDRVDPIAFCVGVTLVPAVLIGVSFSPGRNIA